MLVLVSLQKTKSVVFSKVCTNFKISVQDNNEDHLFTVIQMQLTVNKINIILFSLYLHDKYLAQRFNEFKILAVSITQLIYAFSSPVCI